MISRNESRKFYSITGGLDEPDISAASYIPKQCYGCSRAAELRHRIAAAAWDHIARQKGCFDDVTKGGLELGEDAVRAMDRLKQENLQARDELSQLIAHCEGLASMCETVERNGEVVEIKITACMSPSLLHRDLDDQGVEGNSL